MRDETSPFRRFLARTLCVLILGQSSMATPGFAAPQAPPEPRAAEEPTFPPDPPGFAGALTAPDNLPASASAAPGDLPLLPSWNLVSLPNQPPDPTSGAVFAPLGNALSRAFAYDACAPSDPWKAYDPSDPAGSDLTTVGPEAGFWVEAATAASLPLPGTQPATTTIHLCRGWNLIGFPASEPRLVQAALASIAGRYARVFGYDPADAADPWEIFDVAVPAWANDLKVLRPGRGYWILMLDEGDLEITNGAAQTVVALLSPVDLSAVTGPVEVLGTATGPTVTGWTLSSRPEGGDQWTVFASGAQPAENARLATFDPTMLLNGIYEIELEAREADGLSHTGTVRTYAFDRLHRLSRETVTGGTLADVEESFTYDAVGNRLTRRRSGGAGALDLTYSYDARNRLTTAGAATWSWDANGNQTARSGPDAATFAWTSEDRLARVTESTGTVVAYAYDADGNRVRTEVTPSNGPPTAVDSLLDLGGSTSQVLAEVSDEGVVDAFYVRAGSELLAILRPDGARYVHTDGLGSVRLLTDDAAVPIDRYAYSAFGELLVHEGDDASPFRYAGEAEDVETGLYNLRARWMDPAVGRFASADPFPGIASAPATLHKYLYAENDPRSGQPHRSDRPDDRRSQRDIGVHLDPGDPLRGPGRLRLPAHRGGPERWQHLDGLGPDRPGRRRRPAGRRSPGPRRSADDEGRRPGAKRRRRAARPGSPADLREQAGRLDRRGQGGHLEAESVCPRECDRAGSGGNGVQGLVLYRPRVRREFSGHRFSEGDRGRQPQDHGTPEGFGAGNRGCQAVHQYLGRCSARYRWGDPIGANP